MQKNKVLDSSALVTYFEAGYGSEKVTGIFQESSKANVRIFLSAANWAEVLSVIERRYGLKKSHEMGSLIERIDMEIVPLDKDMAREAAHIKSEYKLHYLDAFAVALAVEKKAELVTADRDFDAVKSLIAIIWI